VTVTRTINANRGATELLAELHAKVRASDDAARALANPVAELADLTIPRLTGVGAALTGAGTLVPVWPAHVANDVALMLVVSSTSGSDGGAPTLTVPAGFAIVASALSTSGATRVRTSLFWARASSSAMSAPTLADSHDAAIARILTFRGCSSSSSPIDAIGAAWGSNSDAAPITLAGVATLGDSRLVLELVGGAAAATAGVTQWQGDTLTHLEELVDGAASGLVLAAASGGLARRGDTGTITATFSPATAIASGFTVALRP